MTTESQFGLYGLIISAILAPLAITRAWFRWLLAGGLALFAAWVGISYVYARFGTAGIVAGIVAIGAPIVFSAYVKVLTITPAKNPPAEIVTDHKDPGFLDEGGLYSWTKGINHG